MGTTLTILEVIEAAAVITWIFFLVRQSNRVRVRDLEGMKVRDAREAEEKSKKMFVDAVIEMNRINKEMFVLPALAIVNRHLAGTALRRASDNLGKEGE